MLPVIIAGAGPIGLALALALAGHRIPTIVLDGADGPPPPRLARTCVLFPDLAHWARLPGLGRETAALSGWHTRQRGRTVAHRAFAAGETPFHLPQHALEGALRAAVAGQELIRVLAGTRVTAVEQSDTEVVVRSTELTEQTLRGSYLVGCDGARSTVRKLLGIGFPGRTAVERHAVAALRTELPWPGEGGVHRGGPGGEVTVRPLPGHRWRLDWPLPEEDGLITPDAMLERVHTTLGGWHDGDLPPYELLDAGVQVCHQRLALRWRSGRVFLAGDAARLLGALGTQQIAEGLRDVENLSWKLAAACHHPPAAHLLDSYEIERRAAVADRLRAVDQALPLVRGRRGLLTRLVRGRGKGRLRLLTDGHTGDGALGAPGRYPDSPLTFASRRAASATPPGSPVLDVPVTALDGTRTRLRHCLGGPLLLLLTAPGSRVWDAKHWLSAGLMPRLAVAARALPVPTELLVTEDYPGATAHTLLVIRPDGHLAATLPGADREELLAFTARWRAETEAGPDGGSDARADTTVA
ncbi:FAD-dependent monooxygenase [Streptomyces xiamenensis]|uniref:FAD-dependent monooxygenase n=1 Tax=Streptomyces xiamenensis TaxID=408015 RepID=UPI003F4DB56F